jgi:hypothetical protein
VSAASNDAAPTDAELAAIKRGAMFVLVGFVLSVVARMAFHGAELSLDAGAVSGAPGMRRPEDPDPDFMLLLPLLMVLGIAKLIEAFGKMVCASQPGRLSYVGVHLSLACDLAALVGLVLRLFNFGRTAGPIVPWLTTCDLFGLWALLPLDYFASRSARPLGLPSITFWARFNMVAATLLISAVLRAEWWFFPMAFGPGGWKVTVVLLFVVALGVVGSYVAILSKMIGLKLAAPAQSGRSSVT